MATFPQVDRPLAAAATLIIDFILYEVRCAVVRPIRRVTHGDHAMAQGAAFAFGWLQPIPDEPDLLYPTPAGRKALHDAACHPHIFAPG